MCFADNNKRTARPIFAYASVLLASKEIRSEHWTQYFGLTSNYMLSEMGKHWITPAGKTSSMPSHSHIWGYSSKETVFSDSLAPHLEYLITQLKFPRTDLRLFFEKHPVKVAVSCYFWNPDHERTALVPEEYKRIISESGCGEILVDEYPQPVSIYTD